MNVMDRVSHDMKNVFSSEKSDKTCDIEELEALIGIVCNPEHIKQEFRGFLLAWNGSIDFQKSNGNENLFNIFSLHEMIEFLSRVFPSLVGSLLD